MILESEVASKKTLRLFENPWREGGRGKPPVVIFLIQSLMEIQTTMDLFQHKYYRLNRTLLQLVGLWPHQSPCKRFLIAIIIGILGVSVLTPQVAAMVIHTDDWDLFVECGASLIFGIFGLNKYISCQYHLRKMMKLLNHMRTDWENRSKDRDADILHKYAERGRLWTLVFTIFTAATWVLFMAQPVVPKIIDVLLRNGSELGEFPVPIHYFIDEQKYYFYISLHIAISAVPGYIISCSYDAMFVVFVQHGCGLFVAMGRKLERIERNETSAATEPNDYASERNGIDFEHLSSCIDNHNIAIEFAELIEATYTWSFLVVVGCDVLLISSTGIQIFKRTIDPEQTLRFIVTNIACMAQLFVNSYVCQILMDHSNSIRYYLLNVKWYRRSRKAQKLLPLMLMRCNTPCKLTAGKVTVMSIESFGMFLKTSMSYFTLMRSV